MGGSGDSSPFLLLSILAQIPGTDLNLRMACFPSVSSRRVFRPLCVRTYVHYCLSPAPFLCNLNRPPAQTGYPVLSLSSIMTSVFFRSRGGYLKPGLKYGPKPEPKPGPKLRPALAPPPFLLRPCVATGSAPHCVAVQVQCPAPHPLGAAMCPMAFEIGRGPSL